MTGPAKERKRVPAYEGTLRSHMITIPACIAECSGIRVFGRRIKSLAFTTDVAIIRNINADAIIAVYPSARDSPGGDAGGGYAGIRRSRWRRHPGASGA